jgi:hypothetical protein
MSEVLDINDTMGIDNPDFNSEFESIYNDQSGTEGASDAGQADNAEVGGEAEASASGKTAADLLAERAGGTDGGAEKAPVAEPTEPKQPKATASEPAAATIPGKPEETDAAGSGDDQAFMPGLPEEIDVEGTKVKTADLLEALGPDVAALIKTIAQTAARSSRAPEDTLARDVQAIRAELDAERFLNRVAEETEHDDVRQILSSKEYAAWWTAQSEGVRRLASSGDPRDAALILNAFKESQGISVRQQQADDKRRRDALHSTSLGASKKAQAAKGRPSGLSDEEEFERLYNES